MSALRLRISHAGLLHRRGFYTATVINHGELISCLLWQVLSPGYVSCTCDTCRILSDQRLIARGQEPLKE